MALRLLALLSSLLFVFELASSACNSDIKGPYPISLVVYNSLADVKNLTFKTEIAYRGILLGAMKKIQASTDEFKFTINETLDYGPYLLSVNGVAGNDENQTYWELLSELQNGTIIMPDVGVGCYIPNPHDKVILKFTKW
ncbi:transcobalamin-1-like [Pygocentrus nattereri]|uniref:transcobalamin-1-like n=1 Tax=Pygocentrus nattereri TaxID=42514 RepID=UPI001891E084|nr:transcobalamin-1-like [Pygocentrus nattereri]